MSMVRATNALECFAQSLLIGAALIYGPSPAFAQTQQEQSSDHAAAPPTQEQEATAKPQTPQTTPALIPTPVDHTADIKKGKQPKHMLWTIQIFTGVSPTPKPPPLSVREKFVIASKDSVDYSSFIWAGVLAGQSFALKSYPELHQGAAGYGRYYWRAFADQASAAYFSEAIVPALTHEDPRYYTLGHGGFFHRTAYALSQVVLTRTDSGGTGFNFSEIVGNGLSAGLSNAYYPSQERGLTKTAENWGTRLATAALNNIFKEFWPDIRHLVFLQK